MGWFAPNVGDIFTFQILTKDTHHIIYHSAVCSALIPQEKTLEHKFSEGDDDHQKPVKQVPHTWDIESNEYKTPNFSPLMSDDIIGCTFLTTPTKDGQWF